MALLKFGAGIVAMSGSIAGNTFARNSSGAYVRARTKPVNPNSDRQVLCRSAVSEIAERWYQTLTISQRAAWATYASAINMKNRLGEVIKLSGFNHYVRTNTARVDSGNTKIDAGPTELSLPEKDPSFAITASVASQKITVTWDDASPWSDIASSFLLLFEGRPQNKTRNFFNGPYQWMYNIPGNGTSPTEVTPVFPLILGQKVWVKGRISVGDGRLGEPMYANCIIAA